MKILKVGPNGGADPRVNRAFSEEIKSILAARETHLPNVAGTSHREDAVDEYGKVFEIFGLSIAIGVIHIVEIKSLEMFPEMKIPMRDKAHCTHRSFSGKEGKYMA
jgi:hypothetical protein